MNFKLNMKKSPYDSRDYIYEDRIKFDNTTNLLCDYRKDLQPIRNQGEQGTCYAQSASCVKEWQERKDYEFNGYFSPQFFYNNREYFNDGINDTKDNLEDDGMTGRDVMRILKNIGICKEKDYPYGTIQRITDIDEKIKGKAFLNRIDAYARVNTLEGLKKSLLDNGPCLIAMPVYNYGSQIWIKRESDDFLGGHAMAVVGYNKNSFIIRNSWGDNWADNGYSYYYFKDWGIHYEIWTTIDFKSKKSEEITNSDTITNNYIENNSIEEDSDTESKIKCPNCIIF